MNLFRSEEHIKNWAQYDASATEGIVSLEDLVTLFSGPYFTRRLDKDWVSNSRDYAIEMVKSIVASGRTGPFWQPPKM